MTSLLLKTLFLMVFGGTTGFNGTGSSNSLKAEMLPFIQVYDIKQIDQFLVELPNRTNFPAFENRKTTGEAVPKNISNRLREMNLALFGRADVLQVVAADGDITAMHKASRKIGFPRDLIPVIRKEPALLDFTLAHAVAHYLYEVHLVDLEHKSPYGNTSRQEYGTTSPSPESASAHAEIDAYAVAILLRMGRNPKMVTEQILGNFFKTKVMVDHFMHLTVSDFTSLEHIPEDYRSQVQDNYIRTLSLVNTMATFNEKTL